MVFSFVLINGIVNLTSISANATNTIIINEYEELKSEYNMLKAKQSIMKSNEISKKIKESENKINKFKNHIYELKEFSVEELRQRNYNDDQIEAIKTYDGLEEKSIKAAATIKFTVKKNTFSYNSKTGLTTVKATVSFTWSGGPEEYGKDAFAMAYEADNNHNFKKISTVSSSLKYKEYIAVGNVKTWSKSAAGKGNQGVTGSYGWEFPFKVMGDKYYAYLSSGTFTTTGVVSGKLKYFNVRYLYSHRTSVLAGGLGITISKSGVSAGITLTHQSYFTPYLGKNGGVETLS